MEKLKSFKYKFLAKIILDVILLGLILFNLVKLVMATSIFMVAKHFLATIAVLFSTFIINYEK